MPAISSEFRIWLASGSLRSPTPSHMRGLTPIYRKNLTLPYKDLSGPVIITANPPAEGMVFDKWVGNSEPQYFEDIDKWLNNTEYIEDIYSSTTFVSVLDYITTVTATYKKK